MLKQGRKVNEKLSTYEDNCVFFQVYKINGEYAIYNKDGDVIGYTSEDDNVIINSSSYKNDRHSVCVISGEFIGYDNLILDNYGISDMFLMVRD